MPKIVSAFEFDKLNVITAAPVGFAMEVVNTGAIAFPVMPILVTPLPPEPHVPQAIAAPV